MTLFGRYSMQLCVSQYMMQGCFSFSAKTTIHVH